MQNALPLLLAGAFFMLPAAHAQTGQAADGASAPLSSGEIKAQRQFKMLDFNHDGKLSRGEVSLIPKLAAAFDATDTNRDGYVTYAEVRAFAVKYRAARAAAGATNSEATSSR